MTPKRYFFGADGGGTKTTAEVCDEEGNIVSTVVGKSINYNSVGMDKARENMKNIMNDIESETGINRFCSAFIGMSALFTRATEKETFDFTHGIIDSEKIVMDTDLYIALEAMNCDGACAVAISGTGSMAVGRNPEGEILHTGGWGYILGDEGSGYTISLDALRAGISSFEKSGRKTLLEEKIAEFYNVKDMYKLVDVFYDPPKERCEIAKFVPAFFECVEKGDEVSLEIAEKNAEAFSGTVIALLKQLPEGIKLGLWGGVFTNNHSYREMFRKHINDYDENCCVSVLSVPPEIGALIAAVKNSSLTSREQIIENLAKNKIERLQK